MGSSIVPGSITITSPLKTQPSNKSMVQPWELSSHLQLPVYTNVGCPPNHQASPDILLHTDDIFLIRSNTIPELTTFLNNLNQFHPSLYFTHQYSTSTIDFLDFTIYKGFTFHLNKILDTKTYHKPPVSLLHLIQPTKYL